MDDCMLLLCVPALPSAHLLGKSKARSAELFDYYLFIILIFSACPNPPLLSCPAPPCPCLPLACSSPILPPHVPGRKSTNVNCVWTQAEDLKVRAEQRCGSVHLLSCTWRCEVSTIYLAEMLTQTFWFLIHKKHPSRPRCTHVSTIALSLCFCFFPNRRVD